MDKKDLVIIFTKEADTVLDEIMEKYNLQETDDKVLDDDEKNLPKIVTIDYLVKDFVKEKISTEKFLDGLSKGLNIPPETTKLMAKDIIQDLIPLLDKVSEDGLEEYNTKKDEEDKKKNQGGTLAQEILRKISAKRGIPDTTAKEPQENPVKEVGISNVEENAKHMDKQSINTPQPNVSPQKEDSSPNQGQTKKVANDKLEPEKKGPDTYREPIE